MAWTWQYEGPDGHPVDDPLPPTFPSQSDAETFIGESWRELLEQGVARVTLLEDGRVVYGPMGLEPA